MAFDDEIPAYRPRSRPRRVRDGQNSSFAHAVLSKMRGLNSAIGGAAGRARVAVRAPGAGARRVIVKLRYVQGDLAKSSRLHLAYVEREGVERDGTPGKLYTRADPEQSQDPDVIREEMQRELEGEKHQFRLIVAPEDGAELDLTGYMREYMARVERDMKQRLIWAAVNHFDTDQPHAHLIIRGVDRDGAEVRFQRAYVQRGLRHRAQELATEELGPRTQLDHERQLAKEVHQARLTSLDRRIGQRAVDGVVRIADLGVYERERMRVLVTMRLAEAEGRGQWRMADGWAAQLKADGERHDIIKQMHRALPIDPARYQVIERFAPMPAMPTEVKGAVHGRVLDKGLSDRALDGMYVIVETARGNGYFVPLWKSEHQDVRIGDLVSLSQLDDSWAKPIDEHIAALASRGQGEIDVGEVLSAIERRLGALQQAGIASGSAAEGWRLPTNFLAQVEVRGGDVASPDAGTAAIDKLLEQQERGARGGFAHAAVLNGLRKRLGELAELGLVAQTGGEDERRQRWAVEARLVEKLKARDVSEPKQHISLRREALRLEAQLEYEGPTWLDRVEPLGHTGLPAELGETKARRKAFLESRGVTDMKGLRALERDAVTKLVGAELGLKSSDKIGGFVGKVERLHRCPNGNHYAVVVSEGKLVAVATGRGTARLIGREVQLDFVKSEYTKRTKLAITTVSELRAQRKQKRNRGR